MEKLLKKGVLGHANNCDAITILEKVDIHLDMEGIIQQEYSKVFEELLKGLSLDRGMK